VLSRIECPRICELSLPRNTSTAVVCIALPSRVCVCVCSFARSALTVRVLVRRCVLQSALPLLVRRRHPLRLFFVSDVSDSATLAALREIERAHPLIIVIVNGDDARAADYVVRLLQVHHSPRL
jgi:hypothetical protein